METQKVKPGTVKKDPKSFNHVGGIIKVHFYLRHCVFPFCAINFLEYIEGALVGDGKSKPDTELDRARDFFHIILSNFWWLTTLAKHVRYVEKKGLKDPEIKACLLVAVSYVVILDHFYFEAKKYFDQEEFMEWILSKLSLKNAGVVFGSFTEYSALSVAMRFVTNIYGGHIKTDITNIFGENVVWGDISRDDIRLEELFDKMRGVFSTIMPPVKDWPTWKFRLDAESFTYKLCAEFEKFEATFSGSHINIQNRFLTTNQTEKNILETIGRDLLTGPQIAAKSGYPYGRNLKAKLSELLKRGFLDNIRGQGYSVTPEYYPLLEMIKST